MAGAGLRLEARDYASPAKWRWVLTDADSGELIADHEVRLSREDWQFEAFADLPGYLAWHVAPDKRAVDEPGIVRQVGEWVTASVLGPVADALARRARRGQVTVEVIAPGGAGELLSYPLELAHVNGRPLSVKDVTFVRRPNPDEDDKYAPTESRERLRVLGLFSLPEGGQPLNLRRERQALTDLIADISAAGKAAEVRTIQYGVTRDQLRDVLADNDGWDIIHISGHGSPGELLLETADGAPDRISASALANLLDGAREHVKLVTIAACWSAALPAIDRHLGLQSQDPQDPSPQRSVVPPAPPAAWGTLASELAGRLGCAVLAMRYPVDDEFAIALSARLYDLLARHGQPLPRALATTLRQLADLADEEGQASSVPVSALSLVTPALYGSSAAGLSLAAPSRTVPASYDTARLKLAGFPPPPDRFVGRTRVMARASAALASRSGLPGVLLHGMPGGGKTACALELAYGHAHSFDRLVWYKAPDEGLGSESAAIEGSLTNFALTLERYLPGFQMAHLLTSQERLDALLPLLTELAEVNRFLLVIDNAESLLTEGGEWRDPQWGQVMSALTGHRGLGRLVLTSRRVPMGDSALPRLRVESVDALSPREALLLARELPDLRRLIYGELPGLDRETSRTLALGVLNTAQGHPKLLELANGQAGHPELLAKLVQAGDQAWREQGGLPDRFFATGEMTAPLGATASPGQTAANAPAASTKSVASRGTEADFWHVLAAWTRSVADTLAPGERDLFWFLCCLEELDRERAVLDGNWADLWQRLGHDGPPPRVNETMAAIAARGLTAIPAETDEAAARYAIHPGVAEAGRAQAGQAFQDAVDARAASYWTAVFGYASGVGGDGSVHTRLLVRAGLAAVPYYLRQQRWDAASYLLMEGFLRDPSRASAAAVLPAIQQMARHDPGEATAAAMVLEAIDPVAAEPALRAALDAAVARGDYRRATVAAGQLADLCRAGGRLAGALHLAEQVIGYTRQAGLGPWTQLSGEGRRLQVLNAMGQASQVLEEIARLRARMDALPATPAADIAGTRFNDYFPLLRLGRTDEALALLLECRQVFQDAHDTAMLGMTLSALGDAENQRGHGEAALRLERDALRYKYLAGDVAAIAVSYHNLGNRLRVHARQAALALACHLASALIEALAGTDDGGQSIRAAATDLRGLDTVPPRDVADLCDRLADIPGTDLPRLIAALSPDPQTAEQALRDLITQAQELTAILASGDSS